MLSSRCFPTRRFGVMWKGHKGAEKRSFPSFLLTVQMNSDLESSALDRSSRILVLSRSGPSSQREAQNFIQCELRWSFFDLLFSSSSYLTLSSFLLFHSHHRIIWFLYSRTLSLLSRTYPRSRRGSRWFYFVQRLCSKPRRFKVCRSETNPVDHREPILLSNCSFPASSTSQIHRWRFI